MPEFTLRCCKDQSLVQNPVGSWSQLGLCRFPKTLSSQTVASELLRKLSYKQAALAKIDNELVQLS
ncbi:hypothetical protein AAHH88_00610 [Candidatus Hodgkinia cicadicola]